MNASRTGARWLRVAGGSLLFLLGSLLGGLVGRIAWDWFGRQQIPGLVAVAGALTVTVIIVIQRRRARGTPRA